MVVGRAESWSHPCPVVVTSAHCHGERGFAVKEKGLGEVYQGRGNLILLKVKGFMVLRVSPLSVVF